MHLPGLRRAFLCRFKTAGMRQANRKRLDRMKVPSATPSITRRAICRNAWCRIFVATMTSRWRRCTCISTTASFTELGRRLQRPAVFRIPAALLHRVAGDFADELLLGGQRVIPNKALSSGFVFRHETLRSTFEAIL
jgi:hypothetical protein